MLTSPALQAKSLWSYNPIPRGCVFYQPLWSSHTRGLVSQSIDPYHHTCTRTASGILHFDGTSDSSVNCGAIHNATAKLWVSFWFKLDSAFSSASPTTMYLCGKRLNATNFISAYLNQADGKLYLQGQDGGTKDFYIVSAETSWNANQWYHVKVSVSDVQAVRLRINAGTAVTDASTLAAPNGGNFMIGSLVVNVAGNFVGEMKEVVCGIADINATAELALYETGTLPTHTEYWSMDEGAGTGAGAIKDHQPDAAADGALDSACTWENVPMHQRANGHYFDGFDDYIDCGTDASLDITGAFTIEVWVRWDGTSAWQVILTKGTDSAWANNNYLLGIIITTNKLRFTGTLGSLDGLVALTANAWTHIVCVADLTNQSIYQNGVQDDTKLQANAPTTVATALRIGTDDTTYGFYGKIGEARIYNRALSVGEIAHIYSRTKGRYS